MTNDLQSQKQSQNLELEEIETGIGKGFIGFTSFEEAEQYAEEHNMEIMLFVKRKNEKYWSYSRVNEPVDVRDLLLNWDLYSSYYSAADFWEEVEDTLSELREDENFTPEEISKWLENQKNIKAQMEQMSDNEFALIWAATDVCEILPKLTMSWYDDFNDISYQVGCFQDEDYFQDEEDQDED